MANSRPGRKRLRFLPRVAAPRLARWPWCDRRHTERRPARLFRGQRSGIGSSHSAPPGLQVLRWLCAGPAVANRRRALQDHLRAALVTEPGLGICRQLAGAPAARSSSRRCHAVQRGTTGCMGRAAGEGNRNSGLFWAACRPSRLVTTMILIRSLPRCKDWARFPRDLQDHLVCKAYQSAGA